MDYSSGKIYKIVSESTDKIYIGSTIKTLEERLEKHEEYYIKWLNNNLRRGYCTSYEILKYGTYKILLVEDYPCSCVSELVKQEGKHQILHFYNCVNTHIAGGRPRITKIDINEHYTCYCGQIIQNHYKIRYKHIRSQFHRNKIKETHINFIKNNPKYEVHIIYK